jgi:UTP--glucose-1-phosphate uridylyltransferase
MKPNKAIITAANPAEKHLPLQTITNAEGDSKTVLENCLDDLVVSGIESVAIVVAPNSISEYRAAAGSHAEAITFIEQEAPRGYGHAVWCAKEFVADDPFVLIVGDHLFLSSSVSPCVKQLLSLAAEHDSCFSAVQATDESKLYLYGTIGATRNPSDPNLFEVNTIIEKPTPTLAEQELIIPGLRHGTYLCFFGIQILKPSIMTLLDRQVEDLPEGQSLGLTPALAEIAKSEKFLAAELQGTRFNLGERHGLLKAQIALALAGPHREDMLVSIIELLAASKS